MSIYILTHPLRGNYGGMLQAYALVCACNLVSPSAKILLYPTRQQASGIARRIRSLVDWCKQVILLIFPMDLSSSHAAKIAMADEFKKSISPHIEYCPDSSLEKLQNSNCRFVVGSDQVWRASYARGIVDSGFFFLNFLNRSLREKSISYSASFGSSEWEGNFEETLECKKLLKDFKAVSVREYSGVKLCKDVFQVDAVQMPDPTLLHPAEFYSNLITSSKTWLPEKKFLAAYILDGNDETERFLSEVSDSIDLYLQHLMPRSTAKKRRDRFPVSVPQWLRLIRDCECFITDSFHGCVFAILFNKPFVCLGNLKRGNARFEGLLSTFDLQERLLTSLYTGETIRLLNKTIACESLLMKLRKEKDRGMQYLSDGLS